MAPGTQSGLRLIEGTAWMVGMRWSMRLAGLASTLILARLLAPEDFGIIAMAKVALGLLEALSTSGVELALIRTPDRSRDLYNTAWTIRFLQRAIMACLLFLLAPLAVGYFNEPRTLPVIQLLAAATLIKGLTNIGTVDFRKDLNFAAEFRLHVLDKLVSVVIAIILAVVLRNYWALAIAIVADAFVGATFSYVLHPYRPRFSLSRWSKLWRFSMWIFANRIAFFINARIDQIFVGGTFSTSAMGYYNFGTELGTLPGDEVAEPFRRSVYPNLATLLADQAAFSQTTITVFGVTAFLLLPIGFGLAAIAPSFVPVVLGAKWSPAIPILAISALYGAIQGLTSVLELPLLITGRERRAAIIAWMQVALLTPTVFFATKLGDLQYVAVARALVILLAFLLMIMVVAKSLSFSPIRLVSSAWRSLVASVIMYAVITRVSLLLGWGDSMSLLSSIALGVVTYPLLALGLWLISGRAEGPESKILQWLAQKSQNWRTGNT
jgi:lipopolysaccharide exporter